MEWLRCVVSEAAEHVRGAFAGEPKSPVEVLLDEYLDVELRLLPTPTRTQSMQAAIPVNVLNDFASRTNNVVDYPFIMERIWEVLIDHQNEPWLMKKALVVLHHLLVNGSIDVFRDCLVASRFSFLDSVATDYNRYEAEMYEYSKNLDIGAAVRKLATDIMQLLRDEQALFRARRLAEKMSRKLAERGVRGSGSAIQVPSIQDALTSAWAATYDGSTPNWPRQEVSVIQGSIGMSGQLVNNDFIEFEADESTPLSSRH